MSEDQKSQLDSHWIITDFIEAWYEKKRRDFNGLINARLPEYSLDDLQNLELFHLLEDISLAADGKLENNAERRKWVDGKINQFMSFMFSDNISRQFQLNTSIVARDFWASPIGSLILRAQVWVLQDELITLTEASRISGRSLPVLRGMIDRHTIEGYPDFRERNPQRKVRVLKSQIMRMTERQAKNN